MKRTDVLISLGLMAFAIAVVVLALTIAPHAANAQHDHDLYHVQYQDWYSNAEVSCCNSKDCGAEDEDHVRDNGDHIEVKVEEPGGEFQWCPVMWSHLIKNKSGKVRSPDWSVAHACIQSRADVSPGTATCSRLLCFMDKARD